jgi:hypothetical protein
MSRPKCYCLDMINDTTSLRIGQTLYFGRGKTPVKFAGAFTESRHNNGTCTHAIVFYTTPGGVPMRKKVQLVELSES